MATATYNVIPQAYESFLHNPLAHMVLPGHMQSERLMRPNLLDLVTKNARNRLRPDRLFAERHTDPLRVEFSSHTLLVYQVQTGSFAQVNLTLAAGVGIFADCVSYVESIERDPYDNFWLSMDVAIGAKTFLKGLGLRVG